MVRGTFLSLLVLRCRKERDVNLVVGQLSTWKVPSCWIPTCREIELAKIKIRARSIMVSFRN